MFGPLPADILLVYWFLGFLALFFLLPVLRRMFSPRARVCKYVFAAQNALDRRDFPAFDQNLEQARKRAEALKDEALRLEFRGDLALMAVQGTYWRGDLAGAELAARDAIQLLESLDPADKHGRLSSAYTFLGDILLDGEQTSRAVEEFRAGAHLARSGSVPIAAIFSLQKLADALLEADQRQDAAAVIDQCEQIERDFFSSQPNAAQQPPSISMIAPDRSLVRGEFAEAEKLFDEKVKYFANCVANAEGIDVMRYHFHLAEAQLAQGKTEQARATLTAASASAERSFGPQHPRVARVKRKLAAIQQA
jgi:tetratricopeptide (TPR) repeat protein